MAHTHQAFPSQSAQATPLEDITQAQVAPARNITTPPAPAQQHGQAQLPLFMQSGPLARRAVVGESMWIPRNIPPVVAQGATL